MYCLGGNSVEVKTEADDTTEYSYDEQSSSGLFGLNVYRLIQTVGLVPLKLLNNFHNSANSNNNNSNSNACSTAVSFHNTMVSE